MEFLEKPLRSNYQTAKNDIFQTVVDFVFCFNLSRITRSFPMNKLLIPLLIVWFACLAYGDTVVKDKITGGNEVVPGDNTFDWDGNKKLSINVKTKVIASFSPKDGEFVDDSGRAIPIDEKAWDIDENSPTSAVFSTTLLTEKTKAYPTMFYGDFQVKESNDAGDSDTRWIAKNGLITSDLDHFYINMYAEESENYSFTVNGKKSTEYTEDELWAYNVTGYPIDFEPAPNVPQSKILEKLHSPVAMNEHSLGGDIDQAITEHSPGQKCGKKPETCSNMTRLTYTNKMYLDVSIIMEYPQWDNQEQRAKAGSEMLGKWDAYQEAIKKHEEGHWVRNREYYSDPFWKKWTNVFVIEVCCGEGGPQAREAVFEVANEQMLLLAMDFRIEHENLESTYKKYNDPMGLHEGFDENGNPIVGKGGLIDNGMVEGVPGYPQITGLQNELNGDPSTK